MKAIFFAILCLAVTSVTVQGLFLGGLGLVALKSALVGYSLGGLGRGRWRGGYRNRRRYGYGGYGYGGGFYGRRRRSIEDEEDNDQLQDTDDYDSRRLMLRSIEDEENNEVNNDLIAKAELQDTDDCAKMFICQLNAKTNKPLDPVEEMIKMMFGTNPDGALDTTKSSVMFDLAATVGQVGGLEQCKVLYGRCDAPYKQLLEILETDVDILQQ